jgi:hypothetical protein
MPVEVVALSTTDQDVAHALLDRVYGPEQPITWGAATEPFACDLRMMTAGSVGADRIRLPVATRCVLAPVDLSWRRARRTARCGWSRDGTRRCCVRAQWPGTRPTRRSLPGGTR